MDMVEQILPVATCLESLTLKETRTTIECGQSMLEAISNATTTSMQTLDLSGAKFCFEKYLMWFSKDDDTRIDLLVSILAKQPEMKVLKLLEFELSES